MFNPPRCPIEWCGAVSTKDEPFFQRWGSYAVMCKGCRIPRFRCRECKRTFSTQTFRMDYREKRPDLNVEIVKRFCSRAGLRQTSFVLRISMKTVIKKLKKIGEHLGRLHEHLMGNFQSGRSFQLDELETFETDRIERPVTMPVRLGFVDVLLHVTLRIDDRSLAVRTQIIRGVRQTSEIELLEVHTYILYTRLIHPTDL